MGGKTVSEREKDSEIERVSTLNPGQSLFCSVSSFCLTSQCFLSENKRKVRGGKKEYSEERRKFEIGKSGTLRMWEKRNRRKVLKGKKGKVKDRKETAEKRNGKGEREKKE